MLRRAKEPPTRMARYMQGARAVRSGCGVSDVRPPRERELRDGCYLPDDAAARAAGSLRGGTDGMGECVAGFGVLVFT